MSSLLNAGHNRSYRGIQSAIETHPRASDEELRALPGQEDQSPDRFPFVRAFAPVTGSRGLLAWDLSRLIFLARDGYALGYIDENEAWKWIDSAAVVLRESYSSWHDLGSQFLVGRMFWGGVADASRLYLEGDRARGKLLAPDGLWAGIPWPPRSAADSNDSQDLK
jgi:hypothetical protein